MTSLEGRTNPSKFSNLNQSEDRRQPFGWFKTAFFNHLSIKGCTSSAGHVLLSLGGFGAVEMLFGYGNFHVAAKGKKTQNLGYYTCYLRRQIVYTLQVIDCIVNQVGKVCTALWASIGIPFGASSGFILMNDAVNRWCGSTSKSVLNLREKGLIAE